jgi:hypothetical protein
MERKLDPLFHQFLCGMALVSSVLVLDIGM